MASTTIVNGDKNPKSTPEESSNRFEKDLLKSFQSFHSLFLFSFLLIFDCGDADFVSLQVLKNQEKKEK